MKNRILSFIREIVIVILGILIALSINTWNENRKNENYIQKALNTIEEEVKLNKENLLSIYKRHQLTIDSIQAFRNDPSISIRQILKKVHGFQIAETQNLGFKYFVSNRTDLIDFEILTLFSQMESLNQLLTLKTNKLIEHLYDHMESKKETDKFKFLTYLSEVMESEQNLLELYDYYLQKSKNR